MCTPKMLLTNDINSDLVKIVGAHCRQLSARTRHGLIGKNTGFVRGAPTHVPKCGTRSEAICPGHACLVRRWNTPTPCACHLHAVGPNLLKLNLCKVANYIRQYIRRRVANFVEQLLSHTAAINNPTCFFGLINIAAAIFIDLSDGVAHLMQ